MALEQLVITNDLVQVVRHEVLREIPLSALIPMLGRPIPSNFSTLPHNVRHIYVSPGDQVTTHMIVEQSPMTHTIVWMTQHFTIRVPWTYFVLNFHHNADGTQQSAHDYRVFVSNERSQGLQSRYWAMPLWNVYGDGRVCWGSAGVNQGQNLGDWADQLISAFWESRFNRDIQPHSFDAAHTELNRWAQDGVDNPEPWRNWRWNTTGSRTLAEIIQTPPNRLDPVITDDAIPELPLGATFGRVEDWIGERTIMQQDTLFQALVYAREHRG